MGGSLEPSIPQRLLLAARDLRKTPSAKFVVKYSSQRMGGADQWLCCLWAERAYLQCEQLVGPLREALSAWIGS